METNTNSLQYSKTPQLLTIACFFLLAAWWVYSFFILGDYNNLIWGASYQVIAALGAVFGFIASFRWGGLQSALGRSIFFFALGLTFQVFGQSTFSYYNLVAEVDIPYPSIADIGYFGSIPLYIYATFLLLRVSGGVLGLKSYANKAIAVVLPLVMLGFSYYFFLNGYEFDWSAPLNVFLDFGYPLGQAIYVSLALLTYVLSKKYLGGTMKNSILTILFGLVVQYIADYNFLFQAYRETWVNGGYGDFLYLIAYLVMTFGLINLGHVFENIKEA